MVNERASAGNTGHTGAQGELRSFFIETWGCQMNRYDSERIEGQLRQAGMLPAATAAAADLVLLNTCSVRDKPVQKILSRIGQLERQVPPPAVAVCGCVAEQEAAGLLKRSQVVRLVLGPSQISRLGNALAHLQAGGRPVLTGFDAPQEHESVFRKSTTRGMITVIEGCDQRCTFCVVPDTRGPEVSQPVSAILQQVEQLIDSGVREVELLGQTVNAYSCPETGTDLAGLLEMVSAVPTLERVRFITSHPRHFNERLIQALARQRKLSRYLHLPFQAGSDRILRRMNRGYNRAEYIDLIEKIRAAAPEINLSTDVIVGFPGETEAEFAQTLSLLEKAQFGQVFAFAYSERPGTPAARLTDDIPLETKKQRLHRLFALTDSISQELNQQLVGRQVEVLIDGESRRSDSDWQGRGEDNRVVNFPKAVGEGVGDTVSVRITRALSHSLYGELTEGSSGRLPVVQ
jgi:tRNA-2-methylthio-N6-dimethylallyladenosine synthase